MLNFGKIELTMSEIDVKVISAIKLAILSPYLDATYIATAPPNDLPCKCICFVSMSVLYSK